MHPEDAHRTVHVRPAEGGDWEVVVADAPVIRHPSRDDAVAEALAGTKRRGGRIAVEIQGQPPPATPGRRPWRVSFAGADP